ncbi:unnamed protein product, partial [marine sediment metagenome]
MKYLSKFAPIYLIYGNADYSNKKIRKLSKEIGKKLPLMTNDLKNISGVKIINNKIINFNSIKIGGLEYFVDNCWIKEFNVKDKKEIQEAKIDTIKGR